MQNAPEWTLEGACRPSTTAPLGVFIERRFAIWVELEHIDALRASTPRLRPLLGIRGAVYGLSWVPGAASIFVSRFLCLCTGCHAFPTSA